MIRHKALVSFEWLLYGIVMRKDPRALETNGGNCLGFSADPYPKPIFALYLADSASRNNRKAVRATKMVHIFGARAANLFPSSTEVRVNAVKHAWLRMVRHPS